jgi:hypothetical protein
LRAHLDAVDVVHVQGVHPGQRPEEVAAAAEVVRASGTPLVLTGYHLSDPAGSDRSGYAAQLDALVPRADAVLTLTETAAAEMHLRWGVQAMVLPHPHVVDFVRMRAERAPRQGPLRVGVHLATLQLPIDPVRLIDGLTRAVRGLDDTQLEVHAHSTVLDPGSSTYAPAAIRASDRLVRDCGGTLRLHRPFSDAQLWDHLFSLDVSVVPGLHGSHSIWPEACTDLGTWALLPTGTHAAGQQPCLTYSPDGSVESVADSFGSALSKVHKSRAHEQTRSRRAEPEQRWTERVGVAESLRSLYERLLGLDRR